MHDGAAGLRLYDGAGLNISLKRLLPDVMTGPSENVSLDICGQQRPRHYENIPIQIY